MSPFAAKLAFTVLLPSGTNSFQESRKARIGFRVILKKTISVTIVPRIKDVRRLRNTDV